MKSFFEQIYKGSSLGISSELLQKAEEQRKKQFEEKQLETATNLLTTFENAMNLAVQTLRNYRKQAKNQESLVKKYDRCLRYFAATGNPLPMFMATSNMHAAHQFCASLNIKVPLHDDELWKVPEDFKTESAPQVSD